MLSSSKLPKSLWIEALKTTVYILNRVPTKAIAKTPFEQLIIEDPQVADDLPVDEVTLDIP